MRLRGVIFWAHLGAGLVAGAVILVMSVTGTILAFEPQIVDFAERHVRYVKPPLSGTTRLKLDELVSAAMRVKPELKPTGVTLRQGPDTAVSVAFGRDGGVLYVNPYTAQVLGGASKIHDWMHTVEDWHRWLGSREIGRPITGACNLVFLFLAVSGFYLWWPRSWMWPNIKAIILFNPAARGKARDWNWHNTIGFWCAPFLIIITLSGAVISYTWANNLLYRMTGNEPPPPRAQPQRGNASAENNKEREEKKDIAQGSYERFFAVADAQMPGWASMNIRPGQRPDAPVAVTLQESLTGIRKRSQLTLNAQTAQVVKWEPYEKENAGRKLRTWLRYLHTGEALGVGGQIIAFLASAGGIMLVWTGLGMAWHRFFPRRKQAYKPKRI